MLLKLGGSLLTDKRGAEELRAAELERVAKDVAEAAATPGALVIGHGSGSYGHRAAQAAGLIAGPLRPDQRPGLVETQRAAARLHARVLEAFDAAGVAAFSLAPSGFLVTDAGQPRLCFLDPLLGALAAGLLPVVYGDVVLDRSWGAAIASTETVFLGLTRRLLRRRIGVGRVIWAGDTPGVLDEDGQPLPRLDAGAAARLAARLERPRGADVTGGMAHRLETAARLARLGVPSLLLDGRVPGAVGAALAAQSVEGTVVEPGDAGDR